MPEVTDLSQLTPQFLRILELANIENQRGANNQCNKIGPGEVLVGMLQEDDNFGAVLIKSCNLTIADLRNGVFEYKPK